MKKFISYLTLNTLHGHYKDLFINVFWAVIVLYLDNRTLGRQTKFLIFTADGTRNQQLASNGSC